MPPQLFFLSMTEKCEIISVTNWWSGTTVKFLVGKTIYEYKVDRNLANKLWRMQKAPFRALNLAKRGGELIDKKSL